MTAFPASGGRKSLGVKPSLTLMLAFQRDRSKANRQQSHFLWKSYSDNGMMGVWSVAMIHLREDASSFAKASADESADSLQAAHEQHGDRAQWLQRRHYGEAEA